MSEQLYTEPNVRKMAYTTRVGIRIGQLKLKKTVHATGKILQYHYSTNSIYDFYI